MTRQPTYNAIMGMSAFDAIAYEALASDERVTGVDVAHDGNGRIRVTLRVAPIDLADSYALAQKASMAIGPKMPGYLILASVGVAEERA